MGRGENSIYENIIENLNVGVVCAAASMDISVFNQAMERMTEFSRGHAVGKNIREVFTRDGWLVDAFEKTFGEGKVFSDYEGLLHRRLSPPLPVGVSTMHVIDPEGNSTGVISLVKDLSGIKSLESESLRKERLAYIGTFAANLAHEVRNPLGGIRGAAQLLSRKLKDEGLKEYTGVIIKEADRLNSTVKEMLDFTKPAKLRKRNLNIHKILDAVILLLKEEEGPPIIKAYDPSLPPVVGDENGLTQVFLNLIKNGREAVGEKEGEVRVVTRMITEFHMVERGSKEAKFAEIEVADTGCGISKDDTERVFTPFFTTKRGGSGLGLPISYRIIQEHGGFLRIDSTPGKGTKVGVYLPVGIG
ncbi:MAG: PAS domain-containing protein [Deltaproteobacteria bacterium]|nr:PAS domain-containing protein [Deltaproteobacteria bacterium]